MPATDVDHRTRIEEGGEPWDETNLQGLCHPHHSQKTARETGFGGRHD
jgi:5-methylcytosine-specific restriction endonuclease McrA